MLLQLIFDCINIAEGEDGMTQHRHAAVAVGLDSLYRRLDFIRR